MKLLPRYSLLTLLVLTALVAGGVKLWYGPHHVIEADGLYEKVEYTFTRRWSTEKIIDGPFVRRKYDQGVLVAIKIRYWRHDHQVPAWGHDFYNIALRSRESRPSTTRDTEGNSPLAAHEQQQFQAAIEREEKYLRDAGLRSDEYQGNSLYEQHNSENLTVFEFVK